MSKRTKNKKPTPEKLEPPKPPYQPTAREQAALAEYKARKEAGRELPPISLAREENTLTVKIEHSDKEVAEALVANAMGTTNAEFYQGLLKQIGTTGGVESSFILSCVVGIRPRDEVEAMLAAQMGAIHQATMTAAYNLRVSDNLFQVEAMDRALNKLARTYALQMEALARYRGKGEQKMTVEHVHVHSGGQAIVGNVTPGTQGGIAKTENQPHEPRPTITYEPGPTLPGAEPQGNALPVPSDKGEAPLPVARRR